MLRPVASLCQCNWRNSLSSTLNKRTVVAGSPQALAFFFFSKKGILSLACPVRLLETCRGNLFYDIPSSLASQSQIAPAPSFRWIFTIFRIRSRRSALVNTGAPRPDPTQEVKEVGLYITYMKTGSTTISFLLLPDESRRIRFVTSIAGLFSPHLF